jgi:hypothetical protein
MASDPDYRLAEKLAEEIGLRGGDTPIALLEREAAALIVLCASDLVDAMRGVDDFAARVKVHLAESWRFCQRVRAGADAGE